MIAERFLINTGCSNSGYLNDSDNWNTICNQIGIPNNETHKRNDRDMNCIQVVDSHDNNCCTLSANDNWDNRSPPLQKSARTTAPPLPVHQRARNNPGFAFGKFVFQFLTYYFSLQTLFRQRFIRHALETEKPLSPTFKVKWPALKSFSAGRTSLPSESSVLSGNYFKF